MLGTPAQEGYKAGGTQRVTLWGKQASEEQGELGCLCSALPTQPFPQCPMQSGCEALLGHPFTFLRCLSPLWQPWPLRREAGLSRPLLALHLLVLRAAGPIRCCSSPSEGCQQLSSAW